MTYRIGEWIVEPSLNRITKDDKVVRVEPQLMEVLNLLASKSGGIVTKEELKNSIWSDVVVTENVFTRSISSLRKLLDDDPSNPTYIETISKTGYRLKVPAKFPYQKPVEFFTLKLPRRPTLLFIGVALLMGFGAFVLIQTLGKELPLLNYEPIPIAHSNATEYWPSISPDGHFMAFASNKDQGKWDIYAQPIGSETALKLTDHEAAELRPVWSQNGNFVYYIRYEQGRANIYKKPLVGGNEVRIIEAPAYSRGDFDISADEKWLLYNERKEKDLPLSIVRVSLEDGTKEVITESEPTFNGDLNPRFSPDNQRIAFIREKNPASMYLYVQDLKSGISSQVTTIPQSINGFDWSKDDHFLVYGGDRSGLYKLWNINIETGESFVIRAGDYQMVMPRVASNGRHIYAKMKDNVNIWKYDLEQQKGEIWYGNNELNLNPTFSPDGSRVCFTMKKGDSYQLWIADADGENEIPITQFSGSYLTAPSWSADGDYIYFQGFLEGQSDIFRVSSRGGIPQNLTSSDIDEHTPFEGESGTLYFSSNKNGNWSIEQMTQKTSDREKIIELGYSPKYLDQKIYFIRKDSAGIWQFDLDTFKEKLIIKDFHPMNWGAFFVTSNGIYYLNSDNKRIEFLDLVSKESKMIYQPLKRIPRIGYTLSLSPDERYLLFSQIDFHDADIMMLEEQVN